MDHIASWTIKLIDEVMHSIWNSRKMLVTSIIKEFMIWLQWVDCEICQESYFWSICVTNL